MSQQYADTMTGTLAILFRKGLRFGGVIDVGCADGHFSLLHWDLGMLRGAVPLNIDARDLYVESLEAIRAAIGGHYRICAVSDRDGGTIEITQSAHPYWDSPRPADDPYWERVNNMSAQTVKVPARTIDSLVAETALPGPYLLKLDIQGSELAALRGAAKALRGAAKTLADTDAIVVEADTDDFTAIHAHVSGAGFDLFDLVNLGRGVDDSLASFYPIYLSRRCQALRERRLWQRADDAQMVRQMFERRAQVRRVIAETLARLRAAGTKPG